MAFVNQKSISDNIANLLNSAPAGFSEDEEDIDQTSAKISKGYHDDDDSHEDVIRSTIRARNISLLDKIDEKYAGKVSSRKNHIESSEESDNEVENDSDEDSENNDNENDGITQNNESENESILGSDDEQSISQSENEENGERGSSANEDESTFKHFRDTDLNEQVSKGICVRNQLSLWENLLETRIQLQKCLAASNKLPIGEHFEELIQNGGEEYKKKLNETKRSVGNVLDKMIVLQTLLVDKYSETKNLMSEKKKFDKSDEEITSEEENFSEEEEKNEEPISKKRKSNEDYEVMITKKHELYKNYRNDTIQKWNEKSRIGTLSKNKSSSFTILNQIDHILGDKSKLIKRSQMKKSNFPILGESEKEETDIFNENIYDDDDFYHQLLRELIEFKSSDVTDPVQLGRQWIQLQSIRSKMKRKIDTRATKGRKIRYAVHSKLVNFMAPIDYSNTWTDEAKKELFGSLFGKKQVS